MLILTSCVEAALRANPASVDGMGFEVSRMGLVVKTLPLNNSSSHCVIKISTTGIRKEGTTTTGEKIKSNGNTTIMVPVNHNICKLPTTPTMFVVSQFLGKGDP